MMRKLAKVIQTGQWTKDLIDYIRFKDELCVSCGVILCDHRLIIPNSLRKKVIEIAHASHQPIVNTKQLIRDVSKCSLYVFTIIPPRLSDPRNFITVLLVTWEPEQTTLLF